MNEETKPVIEETVPPTTPEETFTPGRALRIAAWVMYIAAYLFTKWLLGFPRYEQLTFAIFTLLFIGLTELVHHERPASRESFVWLGCVLLTAAATVLERGNAVEEAGDPSFYCAVFAVWWVLSRAGLLTAGESGAFLPVDAFNGFVRFPFGHFFLRIRTVWLSLLGTLNRKGRPTRGVWGGLLGAAIALALLLGAFANLVQADAGFERVTVRLTEWLDELFAQLHLDFFDEPGVLIFSLPVGAYLFGLIGGTALESREKLERSGEQIRAGLAKLRLVPTKVWCVGVGAFCVLYAAFFCLQFSYLFGAFVRKLPEGFMVAEYARQGFFELCRVMGINFVLFWLADRTAAEQCRTTRLLCTTLMACSMVFAVISLSKLGLYISCFGFTPRRLLSTWLTLVLLFGSVCAVVSLRSGKKSFKAWMIFGAVSLSLLCLY